MSEGTAQQKTRTPAELMALAEALIFVADEPITAKLLAEILEEDRESIQAAVEELMREYESRGSGLQIREIAGGWQLSTRTESRHGRQRNFRSPLSKRSPSSPTSSRSPFPKFSKFAACNPPRQ
jgi:chromosome segregation and condensation protein ScpB